MGRKSRIKRDKKATELLALLVDAAKNRKEFNRKYLAYTRLSCKILHLKFRYQNCAAKKSK